MKLIIWTNLIVSILSQNCPNGIIQRKEIRQLSDDELNRFFNAILKLHSGSRPNAYDTLVKTHLDYVPQVHSVPKFLVWHRRFIREFEVALQSVDASVTLPYWNWSYDSQAPELSGILSGKYFGGNGDPNGGYCVTDGQFAGWTTYYNDGSTNVGSCLSRQYDNGDRIGALYSLEAVNSIINQATTYEDLRTGMEYAPHARVHNGLGGHMATMASTNDPLFWVHHAYLDKLYYDWQWKSNSLVHDYEGENYDGTVANVNDALTPYPESVGFAMDTRNLCYAYDDDHVTQPEVAQPTPTLAPIATATSATTTETAPVSPTATGNNPTASTTPIKSTTTRPSSSPSNNGHPSIFDGIKLPKNPFINIDKVFKDLKDHADQLIKQLAPQVINKVVVPSNDRANLTCIRTPPAVPDAWIRMNGYNADKLRSQESQLGALIVKYNLIPTYQSPSCLLKRPDMLLKVDATLNQVVVKNQTVNLAPIYSALPLKPLPVTPQDYKTLPNIQPVVWTRPSSNDDDDCDDEPSKVHTKKPTRVNPTRPTTSTPCTTIQAKPTHTYLPSTSCTTAIQARSTPTALPSTSCTTTAQPKTTPCTTTTIKLSQPTYVINFKDVLVKPGFY